MSDQFVKLTWDSGAFSAHAKKETLPVAGYIDHLERHSDLKAAHVNLDVIPSDHTPACVESAAEQSWANLIAMRRAGLKPIPVFHCGERFYWLEKMIGEGFTHIGLGGVAKEREETRRSWLDSVFAYLCGAKGFPEVYVHGFGITSVPLMFRYPWFSVDSVTWRKMSAYGWLLVPHPSGDGYDFTRRWTQIGMTDGGKGQSVPKSVLNNHNHINSVLGTSYLKIVKRWLEHEGFDLDEVKQDGDTRARANVRFFRRAEEGYQPSPFIAHGSGLFGRSKHGQTKPVGRFRILYTTSLAANDSAVLTAEERRERLLSYYWFKDKAPFSLSKYVRTGLIHKKKKVAA